MKRFAADAPAPAPPRPPWPIMCTTASHNFSLFFQYPCGTCRLLNCATPSSSPCIIIPSRHLSPPPQCRCQLTAWCKCSSCLHLLCIDCFKMADDDALSKMQRSSNDFHPFSLRNIPHELRHCLSLPPPSLVEPRVAFQFSLRVPESAPEFTIILNMPWPSICISRVGASFLPPSAWPLYEPPLAPCPYSRARRIAEAELTTATRNLNDAQHNEVSWHSELRVLETEDDLGIELDPLRNVPAQDKLLVALQTSHLPVFPSRTLLLSSFRKDAMAADLPRFSSWPPLHLHQPFSWCCGECRSKKDAFLRPGACPCESPTQCSCLHPATIHCSACNSYLCYLCFSMLDDFFLSTFKLSHNADFLLKHRNQQSAAADEDEALISADECCSDLPSQTSYQELLIESRHGSAASAFHQLFAKPAAISQANGYAVNDFVVHDSSVSSAASVSDSDESYVDSCPNFCSECGQLLPTSQISACRAPPILAVPIQLLSSGPIPHPAQPSPPNLPIPAATSSNAMLASVIPPPRILSISFLPTTPAPLSTHTTPLQRPLSPASCPVQPAAAHSSSLIPCPVQPAAARASSNAMLASVIPPPRMLSISSLPTTPAPLSTLTTPLQRQPDVTRSSSLTPCPVQPAAALFNATPRVFVPSKPKPLPPLPSLHVFSLAPFPVQPTPPSPPSLLVPASATPAPILVGIHTNPDPLPFIHAQHLLGSSSPLVTTPCPDSAGTLPPTAPAPAAPLIGIHKNPGPHRAGRSRCPFHAPRAPASLDVTERVNIHQHSVIRIYADDATITTPDCIYCISFLPLNVSSDDSEDIADASSSTIIVSSPSLSPALDFDLYGFPAPSSNIRSTRTMSSPMNRLRGTRPPASPVKTSCMPDTAATLDARFLSAFTSDTASPATPLPVISVNTRAHCSNNASRPRIRGFHTPHQSCHSDDDLATNDFFDTFQDQEPATITPDISTDDIIAAFLALPHNPSFQGYPHSLHWFCTHGRPSENVQTSLAPEIRSTPDVMAPSDTTRCLAPSIHEASMAAAAAWVRDKTAPALITALLAPYVCPPGAPLVGVHPNLYPPIAAPPPPPLIGIHKNPGPTASRSSPPKSASSPPPSSPLPSRVSNRAITPSARILDASSHTFTPLSPLRKLSSLQRALATSQLLAAPPHPLRFPLPSPSIAPLPLLPDVPIDSPFNPDPAVAARQNFHEFIQAEHSTTAPAQSETPPPAFDSLLTQEADLLQSYLPAAPPSIRRLHQFPLGLHSSCPIGPQLPPYLTFNLDAVFFSDGGAVNGKGSWAVLCRSSQGLDVLSGPIDSSTNNLAELTAYLKLMQFAHKRKFLRILIVSDSEIGVNFLKGHSNIDAPSLFDIAAAITSHVSSFQAIFASHVPAHANASWENAFVDALCTWTLSSNHAINHLHLNRSASNLSSFLLSFNTNSLPETSAPRSTVCSCCLKKNDHTTNSCPLMTFSLDFLAKQSLPPCLACLACDHLVTRCPLMSTPKRVPCPSLLIAEVTVDISTFGPMADLSRIDFSILYFPQKQSHVQFVDYWTTVTAKLLQASSIPEAIAAGSAAAAWSLHYHIDGLSIRQRKPFDSSSKNKEGSNNHPSPEDADLELAKRAMRAARLGPDARASDVSKALRKGQAIPLDDKTIAQLALLYPTLAANTPPTIFDAPPLPAFAANRYSVARAVMSRSPHSHPGKLGISFAILQLFCTLTFKRESANSPDLRWSIFCELIANIMAGKAIFLSPMFHEVVGVFFDKNFEKAGAAISLRNIGVEESLVRIASALVFQEVIHQASTLGFLSCWELGCGIKSGAEIFGRIGAVTAHHGMVVAVFDVEKAFNNIRRSDIKNAVEALNHPLLSAFTSFLFASNPTVHFKDASRSASFTLWQGILQGNPLSTFLFSLTICWILKPFRAKYPLSLTPSFVDDLQLIGIPSPEYAPMLKDFMLLFHSHGLRFDLSDGAKSSAFSVSPLPAPLLLSIAELNVKTQTTGIAPCKIPFGTPSFMSSHIAKQQEKLLLRARAFRALWPALLNLKPSLKSSRIGIYEGFLNLLRLSFISMSTYTLRTVPPLFCAPYADLASSLARELIDLVFPPSLNLIGNRLPFGPILPFPSMMNISIDIMQLPLSLGGLSLRLPREILFIAYAASCGECIPYLNATAARLRFSFSSSSLPGLSAARTAVSAQLDGFLIRRPLDTISFERAEGSDPAPLQETLTTLLNHATITRISVALSGHSAYAFAFLARVDKQQDHCSWPFNPVARRNLNLSSLSDDDFSRAIQLATLRPITSPRMCDCGAIIDPVGLHFLYCKFVHFGYLHDCVKTAIVSTVKSFQPLDLALLSVSMEKKVSNFYPLRNLLLPEGPQIKADIVVSAIANAQQDCIIADVSSVLARSSGAASSSDFHALMRARSRDKRAKYRKYDIPPHLFHPITVGRSNVLSTDALFFCTFMSKFFPAIPKAFDRLRASISRAVTVGAARTVNTAIRRSQLAAFQGISFSSVPKSAACSLFAAVSVAADDPVRLRDAIQPASDALPLAVPATQFFRGSRGASSHSDSNYRPSRAFGRADS
jgi:ribonuclease HI